MAATALMVRCAEAINALQRAAIARRWSVDGDTDFDVEHGAMCVTFFTDKGFCGGPSDLDVGFVKVGVGMVPTDTALSKVEVGRFGEMIAYEALLPVEKGAHAPRLAVCLYPVSKGTADAKCRTLIGFFVEMAE